VERLVQEDVKVNRRDSGYVLVNIDDNEGVSPLYLATTLRQLDIVQFLTQQQRCGDVLYPTASYAGPGSKTALHAAVLLSKGTYRPSVIYISLVLIAVILYLTIS
jgi:hypothetical protein